MKNRLGQLAIFPHNKARKPLPPVTTIPKTLARFWNHFAQRYIPRSNMKNKMTIDRLTSVSITRPSN